MISIWFLLAIARSCAADDAAAKDASQEVQEVLAHVPEPLAEQTAEQDVGRAGIAQHRRVKELRAKDGKMVEETMMLGGQLGRVAAAKARQVEAAANKKREEMSQGAVERHHSGPLPQLPEGDGATPSEQDTDRAEVAQHRRVEELKAKAGRLVEETMMWGSELGRAAAAKAGKLKAAVKKKHEEMSQGAAERHPGAAPPRSPEGEQVAPSAEQTAEQDVDRAEVARHRRVEELKAKAGKLVEETMMRGGELRRAAAATAGELKAAVKKMHEEMSQGAAQRFPGAAAKMTSASERLNAQRLAASAAVAEAAGRVRGSRLGTSVRLAAGGAVAGAREAGGRLYERALRGAAAP